MVPPLEETKETKEAAGDKGIARGPLAWQGRRSQTHALQALRFLSAPEPVPAPPWEVQPKLCNKSAQHSLTPEALRNKGGMTRGTEATRTQALSPQSQQQRSASLRGMARRGGRAAHANPWLRSWRGPCRWRCPWTGVRTATQLPPESGCLHGLYPHHGTPHLTGSWFRCGAGVFV